MDQPIIEAEQADAHVDSFQDGEEKLKQKTAQLAEAKGRLEGKGKEIDDTLRPKLQPGCASVKDVAQQKAMSRISGTKVSPVVSGMSSSSSSCEQTSLVVPRLVSSTINGEPYERRPDVEAEIARALNCSRGEWVRMAEGKDRLSREALVFLIRQTIDIDRDLCGRLIHKLSKSVGRIAQHWAQGFDRITTDEILLQVEIEIIELVLAENPSRQSEFLEIAFGKAVERRTINAVEKRRNSPMPLNAGSGDGSGRDEMEMESPAESVPDECPNPEEIVEQLEDEIRCRALISKASAAVKDPRHLKAVILRHIRGWPITAKDPNKPNLARYFGVSGRQIQNWISNALEAMRAAIGDKR
jgi:hypothetical protein